MLKALANRWLTEHVIMKKLLTDRLLRALMREPPIKRTLCWDTAVPGFCAIATPAGKITFAVIRRLPGGKTPLTRRGRDYPVVTLAAGREWALAALRNMIAGVDPKAKEEAARKAEARRRANSFQAVAEDFIARHVSKLRTGRKEEAAIRRELIAPWGNRPITDISRADVIKAIERLADESKLHASHQLLAYVKKLFAWAIERGAYGLEKSPCDRISARGLIGRREPRQRLLNEAELRTIWQATAALGFPFAPFVQLLLVTGQRRAEVSDMQLAEINLDAAIWTIPADRMKSGAAHEVLLPSMALDIIKGMPRFAGPYVFSTTGGVRPISGFSKAKARLDALTHGITPWRLHDLRRTVRTGLGALPIPSNVCELVIAHAQPGLHKVYDLHSYREEKRRALELWAAQLREIIEPAQPENVVRFKQI
jgi:integrase